MEIDMFSMQMSLTIFTMKKKVTECWEFINLGWSKTEEEKKIENPSIWDEGKIIYHVVLIPFWIEVKVRHSKKNIWNDVYVLLITLLKHPTKMGLPTYQFHCWDGKNLGRQIFFIADLTFSLKALKIMVNNLWTFHFPPDLQFWIKKIVLIVPKVYRIIKNIILIYRI